MSLMSQDKKELPGRVSERIWSYISRFDEQLEKYTDPSRLFREELFIEVNQKIDQVIFFDSGRSKEFRNFKERKNERIDFFFETIVSDPVEDSVLKSFIESMKLKFEPILPQNEESKETLNEKIEKLSLLLVREVFTFFGAKDRNIGEKCRNRIDLCRNSRRSNLVYLGDLKGCGMCRHRSILFKLLCNIFGVPCRIQRGWFFPSSTSREAHMWNEVVLHKTFKPLSRQEESTFTKTVDCMNFEEFVNDEIVDQHYQSESKTQRKSESISVIKRQILGRRGKHIGSGAFGNVYGYKNVKVVVPTNDEKKKNESVTRRMDLAVKEINLSKYSIVEEGEKFEKIIEREVNFLKLLSSHPNIVEVFGSFERDDEYQRRMLCLVMKKYDFNGVTFLLKLRRYISERSENKEMEESKDLQLTAEVFVFLLEVAKGLNYIHSFNIVHYDIKLENILVCWDEKKNMITECVITDFGSSKGEKMNLNLTSSPSVTRKFAAPEILEVIDRTDLTKREVGELEPSGKNSPPFHLFNKRSDIYSYGCLMNHFKEFYLNYPQIISVERRCRGKDPYERPSLMEVIYHLRSCLRKIAKEQEDLVSKTLEVKLREKSQEIKDKEEHLEHLYSLEKRLRKSEEEDEGEIDEEEDGFGEYDEYKTSGVLEFSKHSDHEEAYTILKRILLQERDKNELKLKEIVKEIRFGSVSIDHRISKVLSDVLSSRNNCVWRIEARKIENYGVFHELFNTLKTSKENIKYLTIHVGFNYSSGLIADFVRKNDVLEEIELERCKFVNFLELMELILENENSALQKMKVSFDHRSDHDFEVELDDDFVVIQSLDGSSSHDISRNTENKKLTSLNLEYCHFMSEQLNKFVKLLSKFSNLEELGLQNFVVSQNSQYSFLESILKCVNGLEKLKLLDLSNLIGSSKYFERDDLQLLRSYESIALISRYQETSHFSVSLKGHPIGDKGFGRLIPGRVKELNFDKMNLTNKSLPHLKKLLLGLKVQKHPYYNISLVGNDFRISNSRKNELGFLFEKDLNLLSLNLSGNTNLGNKGAEILISNLKNKHSIRHLTLEDIGLDGKLSKRFWDIIFSNKNIESISIGRNTKFGVQGIRNLAKSMVSKSTKSVRSISLHSIPFDKHMMNEIIRMNERISKKKGFPFGTYAKLDLRDCGITDGVIKDFFSISSIRNIMFGEVLLGNNPFTDLSLKLLFRNLTRISEKKKSKFVMKSEVESRRGPKFKNFIDSNYYFGCENLDEEIVDLVSKNKTILDFVDLPRVFGSVLRKRVSKR